MMLRFAPALLACACLVLPLAAHAQPDAEAAPDAQQTSPDASAPADAPAVDPASEARARELYDNAVLLFEEAQYEAAILAWEEAWRLSREPLLLYNIASAWERLNDLERTLEYLHQYRAFAPADERDRLERRIRALETRLDEQRAQARADAARDAQAEPAPEPVQPTQVIIVRTEPEVPRGLQVARWSLLGLGVAGLGAGTAFALVSRSYREDADAGCIDQGGSTLCGLGASAPLDAERRNALAADVSFAVGGAALVGSLVLFLVRGRTAEPGELSVAPWMTPDASGFFLSTSF